MKKFLFVFGFLFSVPFLFAQNMPIENPQATLVRRAGEQELNITLTKNIFRTEYRDEWHTHSHHGDHHPGHDPSTWHEEYQEQEPYQDVEYYWDWEYYTDYEMRREWVCYHDHRHGNQCHWEWRRVPVTKRRWVQKTRIITRWRTVTKIRLRTFEESHSHLVPVQVYDHTETKKVRVQLPAEAALERNETERFHVSFDGKEVNVTPESSFYPYRTIHYENRSGEVRIVLDLKILDREEYGKSSIEQFELKGELEEARVSFQDTKPFYKVFTSYFLEVIDENSRTVVDNILIPLNLGREPFRTFFVPLIPGQGALGNFVQDFIKGDVDYLVRLKVLRQSVLFEGGQLEFVVELTRKGTLDPSLYGAPSIAEFRLVREDRSVYLVVNDTKANHDKVKTFYSIKISRSTWGVGTTVIGRALWESDKKGTIKFLLKKGADNPIGRNLEEHVEKGTKYDIRLRVERQSALFPQGQVRFDLNREQRP